MSRYKNFVVDIDFVVDQQNFDVVVDSIKWKNKI